MEQQDPRKQNTLDINSQEVLISPYNTFTKPYDVIAGSTTLVENHNSNASIPLRRMDDKDPLFQHTKDHSLVKPFENNIVYSKPDATT